MSAFEQLAPFIQDYIYRHKWQELHEVQVAACDVIFHTDHNLLLATPTASGKTEAAFLPAITEIYRSPSASVGILYISPLKALINDQFLRIEELLDEAGIPVTKWHGDAPQPAKDKVVRKPEGVLQITPESLEAMLMRRRQHVIALFSDLRFIIIDEVHQFIWSDRGMQLSSILERIQALIGLIPRRIGLSATLGDMAVAEDWLNSGTGRDCISPAVSTGRRQAQVMVDHFYVTESTDEDNGQDLYFESLYQLTKGQKSILFSNSREEVEVNINRLKVLAESKKERDIFHVHHGNISADGREYAEEQMRSADTPVVTGATVTLELGIDLGDLDRIVQTGAPHSVSSLTQRLGRSGRRSGISQMCFVFREEGSSTGSPFIHTVNWQFVKCIALIELYRENWLEPMRVEKYPYGILFHQTMSVLYSYGDTSPERLAQKMLSENAFSHIGQEDYALLLRHMLDDDILERTPEGLLALGSKGERLTNHHEFFAVFETPAEYSVNENANEIGTLHHPVPLGERFVLSGKTWEVLEVDMERKAIYVKFIGGKSDVSWDTTSLGDVHTRVLHKMRQIIVSSDAYGYLSPRASLRLMEIRNTIRQSGAFTESPQTDIFPLSTGRYGICPWLGTRALNALAACLQYKGLSLVTSEPGWVHLVAQTEDPGQISQILKDIKTSPIHADDLPLSGDLPSMGKYNIYVPPVLARKQFADRYIDLDEMRHALMPTSI